MPRPETVPEILFTPRAFDIARQTGAVAVTVDLEAMQALNNHVKERTGRELPPPGDNAPFLFYATDQSPHDTHYYQYEDSALFVPHNQLTVPPTTGHMTVSKRAIEEQNRGRSLVTLATPRFAGTMSGVLASALVSPRPETMSVTSLKGWGQMFKDVFKGADVSPAMRKKLIDECIEYFPEAIAIDNPKQKGVIVRP